MSKFCYGKKNRAKLEDIKSHNMFYLKWLHKINSVVNRVLQGYINKQNNL